MALVKGTNSYVDIAETDAYLEDRLDGALWLGASPEVQDQSLVTAFHALNTMGWKGYVVSDDQAMAWPRVGSYYDRSRGKQINFDSEATEAPQRVRYAQIELAVHYVANAGITLDTGNVLSLEVGSVNLETITAPSQIPLVVRRYVDPFLTEASQGLTRIN